VIVVELCADHRKKGGGVVVELVSQQGSRHEGKAFLALLIFTKTTGKRFFIS